MECANIGIGDRAVLIGRLRLWPLGLTPKTDAGYLGTKIAFTRIPEKEEFMA